MERDVFLLISQWNNALNVSMETTNNQNYANILFYGGTQDELNDTGLFNGFQSYTLGLTTYDGCIISEGYFTWSSIRKNCYSISYARSALVNRTAVYTARNFDDDATNDVSSTEITGYHVKTGIHEMGHALGYFGHDTFSTSVMRKGEYLNTTLNLRDTNHLEQVYTIMYEGG